MYLITKQVFLHFKDLFMCICVPKWRYDIDRDNEFVCMCVHCMCAVLSKAGGGYRMPWNHSCKQPLDNWYGCWEPWSSAKAARSLKSWASLRPLSVFERRSPVSQASLGLTMLSGMAVNFYLSCLLPSSSVIRGVCYNAWFKDYWDHAGQTCSIRATFPAPRILRAWFSGKHSDFD